MPTVTAAALLDRAAIALQDTGHVRWQRAELLAYLNAAQREAVLKKPNAYVLRSTAPLVAGTLQTLPTTNDAGAVEPVQLVEVLRNACGRAVRKAERDLLDLMNPDWHSLPQTKTVQHYCYDVADPARYLVYPPNDGAGCLELAYSATPPVLAVESAVIALDDIYQDALLDYLQYRAWNKDAEYAADPLRAAARYAAFAAALDGKSGHERAEAPR
jgi:hypothetical protein